MHHIFFVHVGLTSVHYFPDNLVASDYNAPSMKKKRFSKFDNYVMQVFSIQKKHLVLNAIGELIFHHVSFVTIICVCKD